MLSSDQNERRRGFLQFAAAAMLGAVMMFVVVDVANATFYTDRASWEAAVTGENTIDFEGIAPDNGFTYFGTGGSASLQISGVTFTVGSPATSNLYVIGKDYYYPGTSVLSVQQSVTEPDILIVTLPGAFGAFGIDVSDFNGDAVWYGNGFNAFVLAGLVPSFSFLGFIQDIGGPPLDFLLFHHGGASGPLNVDNFSLANPVIAAVPEPTTLELMVGALSILLLISAGGRGKQSSRK